MLACRSTVCGVRSCDMHANLQLTSAGQTGHVIYIGSASFALSDCFHYMHCQ